MDHSTTLVLVAVPTAIMMMLVVVRIWISSAQHSSPASTMGRLAAHQAAFDWASHFAFGLMAIVALGIALVPGVRGNAWVLGLPLGVVATGIAYTFSRPPLREEEAYSAIDRQSLRRSAAVHILGGAIVAQLIWSVAR